DGADDALVADESRGVLLAGGGLRLVVQGLDLELHAGNGVLLVGVVDGDLDAVLDAEARGRVLAGERGVHADGDGRGGAAVAALAVVVAGATRGQSQCSGGEHGGEDHQRTLSHNQSFPRPGRPAWATRMPRWYRTPDGAVTGRDSKPGLRR